MWNSSSSMEYFFQILDFGMDYLLNGGIIFCIFVFVVKLVEVIIFTILLPHICNALVIGEINVIFWGESLVDSGRFVGRFQEDSFSLLGKIILITGKYDSIVYS